MRCPPGWAGAPSIWGQTDAATQAARSVAALHRARTEWPWAGALILEHYQPASDSDDPRWGFALVQPDGEQRPVFDALASWSGELPDAAPAGGYPAGNRWCSYEGAWRVGRLAADIGADHDRAKFRFDGTGVAVTIRRGPYRANLYVTVDGQPANELPKDRTGRAYVVLYDDASSVSTVPLATDLSSGVHSVTIVAEGGWDQWAIVDWRVAGARPPSRWSWQLGLLGAGALALLTLLVRDVRRRRWEAWSACLRAWPSRLQAGLAVGLTIAVWAALALALTLITRESTWAWSTTALAAALACALVSLGALLALVSASPDLGLSLAVATAPLYLIPQGMIYRALSVTEVVLLLCAAATLVERRHWRRSVRGPPRGLHALDWAVAAFVGSAIVGTALSEDLASAVLELRTVFLFPALVYILLRVMRLGPEDMNRIVIGWCAGAVIIALIGLVLYGLGSGVALAEGGLARLRSIYPSPNNVALYLGRTWPLWAAMVLWSSSSRRRWLTAGGLAVVTLALLLSFSRGALMLGLPAAIVVMCLWAGRPHRWVALGLALAGVLAMLPLAAMPRLASMFDAQAGSTFLRLELWRSSIAAIRDHPLLGLGPGQFATAYRTRYILPTAWSEPNLTHPHNILLDLWTRLGVPGLAAFFAVQWAFWKALWLRRRARTERRTDPLSVGLASSMAALLGHGLVDNTLFAPDLAVILFMTLGLAGALARAGDRADECR